MKKLLIFFTIVTLTNLSAQEKQNDATWEETISFLKKYKDQITHWQSPYRGMPDKPDYEVNNISNTKWVFNGNASGRVRMTNGYTQRKDVYKITISLNKLQKVKMSDYFDDKIDLNTTGNNIIYDEKMYNDGRINERYTKIINSSYFGIVVYDEEMRPRIYKALKHLTYLATKKREEARKNSGEKF